MSQMTSLGSSTSLAAGAPEGSASDTRQTELTIRQMAQRFDVSLRTLRFYESRGLLAPRREGNVRFYRAADQLRMEMILQGRKLGFTLSEISDLVSRKSANDNAGLGERLMPQQIVNQIGHLERQRDQIDSAIRQLRATHGQMLQGAA